MKDYESMTGMEIEKVRPTISRVGCGHCTPPSRPPSAQAHDEPADGSASRTVFWRLPRGLDLAGCSLREPTREENVWRGVTRLSVFVSVGKSVLMLRWPTSKIMLQPAAIRSVWLRPEGQVDS